MTNFSKFAAQQLTKKQMNEVKGGVSKPANGDELVLFYCKWDGGDNYFTLEQIAQATQESGKDIKCLPA